MFVAICARAGVMYSSVPPLRFAGMRFSIRILVQRDAVRSSVLGTWLLDEVQELCIVHFVARHGSRVTD